MIPYIIPYITPLSGLDYGSYGEDPPFKETAISCASKSKPQSNERGMADCEDVLCQTPASRIIVLIVTVAPKVLKIIVVVRIIRIIKNVTIIS